MRILGSRHTTRGVGFEGAWSDTRADDDDGAFRGGGANEALGPRLKAKAVEQNYIGLGYGFRVGRRRLENVSIAVGTDERANLQAVGTDARGHVGEDRKAR